MKVIECQLPRTELKLSNNVATGIKLMVGFDRLAKKECWEKTFCAECAAGYAGCLWKMKRDPLPKGQRAPDPEGVG